jgi:hypothetical protein
MTAEQPVQSAQQANDHVGTSNQVKAVKPEFTLLFTEVVAIVKIITNE